MNTKKVFSATLWHDNTFYFQIVVYMDIDVLITIKKG